MPSSHSSHLALIAVLASGSASSAAAQTLPLAPPTFGPLRFDDGSRELPAEAIAANLKRIDVGDGMTASFGGEVRQRIEHYDGELFGLGPVRDDTYDLSRLLAFADLRFAGGARAFVELGDHVALGKDDPLLETDRDDLDLHQAFLDVPVEPATLRLGRQEMPLGSERFVSYREGPNIRQTFDGARLRTPLGPANLTVFAVKPTQDRAGVFDDRPSPGQIFAGAYLTVPVVAPTPNPLYELPPKPGLAVDAYYYWRRTGPSLGGYRRDTLGLRGWGASAAWDYDLEGISQFGRSTAGRVSAGGASGRIGYTLKSVWWSPRLGLQGDWFSGDRHPGDGRDETTDPLFPLGAYFSEPGLQTFSNIVDVYPSLTGNPTRGLAIQGGVDFVWRASRNDFVYLTPLVAAPGTAGVGGRYEGTSFVLQATWAVAPNLTLAGSLVRMVAGSAITSAGGTGTTYAATWAQFRF